MPLLLHAADIHLDSPMQAFRQSQADWVGDDQRTILQATRLAFEALIDFALEQQVAGLLLAGDLYDGDWKDYSTGEYFIRQMDRLHQAEIPVFIVQGNHDAASEITRQLRLPPNVSLFSHAKPESLESPDGSYLVHGQSYSRRDVTQNLAQGYPPADRQRFNIGLLHTALDGREGHHTYAPCSVSDLSRANYQYWALGHVHRQEIISTDPWVVFPGNLQGRHIQEPGPKGAMLIAYEGTEITSVDPVSFHKTRWEQVTVDITDSRTVDAVLDAVEMTLEQARSTQFADDPVPLVIRCVLTGRTPLHGVLQEPTQRKKLLEEVRSLATRAAGQLVITEDVKVKTTAPTGHIGIAAADLLEQCLTCWEQPGFMQQITFDAEQLRRELDGKFQLDLASDPAFEPAQLLDEASALLQARLMGEGEESP